MTIQVRQLHPLFVGEVSGSMLRKPLDGDHVAALMAAIDRYAVLVFRGQQPRRRRGRWRSRRNVRRVGDAAQRRADVKRRLPARRSATSPTSTRTTRCARATTGAGSTASATGCGTPTPRTAGAGGARRCCIARRGAAAVAARQRRDRVRRHARRLRRAAGRTKAGDRRSGRRARHLLVARPDRLHRIPARRARAVPAVAAAPGAPASRLGAQDAVPVRARLAHRRLAGAGGPPAAARPDRARDAARSSSTATTGGSAIW